MFQKFKETTCGGIHIIVKEKDYPIWKFGQLLMRELKFNLKEKFYWQDAPYEYEFNELAINLINGSSELKQWVENRGSLKELEEIEMDGRENYLEIKKEVSLYSQKGKK